jgi:hypothetical protein
MRDFSRRSQNLWTQTWIFALCVHAHIMVILALEYRVISHSFNKLNTHAGRLAHQRKHKIHF